MLSCLIVTAVLAIIVVFSLRERVRLHHHMRDKNWDVIGEGRASVLSQSIVSTVGTAGGIYLSVVVLLSFLELEMPAKVNLAGIRFEPVAAICFALALIQPFILRVFRISRRT